MKNYFLLIAMLISLSGISQKILKEKIYVGVDKPVYLSGETIYFKAFCTDQETGKPIDLSKIGYVEIIRNQQPFAQAVILLEKGSGNGYLELPSSLVSGTYILRMYTNWMKNFGPGNFFQRGINIINPLSKENPKMVLAPKLELENSAGQNSPVIKVGSLFDRRSKVAVSIDMKGNEGYDLYATTYFIDKTGMPVDVQNEQTVNKVGSQSDKTEPVNIQFIPETQGHIIRAVAKEDLKGKDVYLSVPGRPAKLYTGISDSTGMVSFLTGTDPLGAVVVPQIYFEGNHSGNIRVLSPFSEEYPEEKQLEAGDMTWDLQKPLLAQQVAYHFGQEERELFTEKSDTSMFFTKTEYTYLLDDYTRFPTMEEVLREYVLGVLVQRKGNNYRFESISRDKFGIPTVHQPIVLIDGIPVSANAAIKLDPLKVKRLDVLARPYYYGTAVFDGIISFQTYDGKLGEMNLDPGVIPVEYPGVQSPKVPLFPEYNTAGKKSSRLPDFRTTLYWNPSISGTSNGNYAFDFYTSDMKGKYLIVVEGMNREGKTIRLEKEVMVN